MTTILLSNIGLAATVSLRVSPPRHSQWRGRLISMGAS